MNRNDVPWRGYFAAAPTPFDESGRLDLDSFTSLLRYFLGEGTHGLAINGSSGEWYAQTLEERQRTASAAVTEVAGRVPVIIGVNSSDPGQTEALMAHAGAIGADGVMLAPPAGWRLHTAEVLAYYRDMCGRTELPVMLYNIPADVATDIKPSTVVALSEIPNVVAIKDSTRDDLQFHETVRIAGDRIRVFGNVLTRAGLAMLRDGWGADGYIGGGMLFGRSLVTAFEAAWAGRMDEARVIADRLQALQRDINLEDGNGQFGGIPGQLKAILTLLGQPGGRPRFPRLAVEDDAEALDRLRKVLRDHGLEPVG